MRRVASSIYYRRAFSLLALAPLALGLLLQTSLSAKAEEGGSGHYFPGSMASFMDGVAAQETFIARLNAGRTRPLVWVMYCCFPLC